MATGKCGATPGSFAMTLPVQFTLYLTAVPVVCWLSIPAAEQTLTQSFIHIESVSFLRQDELPDPPDWSLIFGDRKPIALEIGCGIGDFIANTAMDNPDWNFIAIDFYNKGCWKTCRRIDRLGLTNVRVLRVEARQFIAERFRKGSLSAVYINCPDPWPKKKHRKRRLVNRQFLEFIREFMAPDADMYFATDFDDYGIEVSACLAGVEGFVNQLAPDPYRHSLPGYHLSKYMNKFMAEGKKIYFVHYRKNRTPEQSVHRQNGQERSPCTDT